MWCLEIFYAILFYIVVLNDQSLLMNVMPARSQRNSVGNLNKIVVMPKENSKDILKIK